jgi:hypothetical protein
MLEVNENIIESNKKTLAKFQALTGSMLTSSAQIFDIHFKLTRSLFEDGIEIVKALGGAKNVGGLVSISQLTITHLADYSRDLTEIITQSQETISKIARQEIEQTESKKASVNEKQARRAA